MRKRLQRNIEAAPYIKEKLQRIGLNAESTAAYIYGPRRGPWVKGQRVGARGLGQLWKRKTGLTVPTEEGMWMERDS